MNVFAILVSLAFFAPMMLTIALNVTGLRTAA
jgi:hypothetical protein